MITPENIMDAIAKLACDALPELQRIYTDLTPCDFLRPSLLIELVIQTPQRANAGLVRTDAEYTLTLHDVTDDYQHSDARRLLEWQQRLLNLFRCGYLHIGDRAIAVTASTGGRDWDKAYVDLTFTWYDDKEQTTHTRPTIETLQARVQLKNEQKG